MVEGDIEITDGFGEIPPDSTGTFSYAASVDPGLQMGTDIWIQFTREIGSDIEEWDQKFPIFGSWSDTGKVTIDTSDIESGVEGTVRIKLKATNAFGNYEHLGTAEATFTVDEESSDGGTGEPKEPTDPQSIWEQFKNWLTKLGFLLSAGVAAAIAYMATGRIEDALVALVVGGGLGCLVPWLAKQEWHELAYAWLILSIGAGAVIGVYFRDIASGAKDVTKTGISAAAETKGLIL